MFLEISGFADQRPGVVLSPTVDLEIVIADTQQVTELEPQLVERVGDGLREARHAVGNPAPPSRGETVGGDRSRQGDVRCEQVQVATQAVEQAFTAFRVAFDAHLAP